MCPTSASSSVKTSSMKIAGFLPPSSRVTGTKLWAAATATERPTSGLPVNSRWSQRIVGEPLTKFDPTVDDGHVVWVEGLGHDLRHECAGRRRELRHLDHHAVAGREVVGKGAKRHVEGEVPGHDDPHDTLGLPGHHRLAGAHQQPLDRTTLGLHPVLDLLGRSRRASHRPGHLDQVGL